MKAHDATVRRVTRPMTSMAAQEFCTTNVISRSGKGMTLARHVCPTPNCVCYQRGDYSDIAKKLRRDMQHHETFKAWWQRATW